MLLPIALLSIASLALIDISYILYLWVLLANLLEYRSKGFDREIEVEVVIAAIVVVN
jgi:hypothetical protein